MDPDIEKAANNFEELLNDQILFNEELIKLNNHLTNKIEILEKVIKAKNEVIKHYKNICNDMVKQLDEIENRGVVYESE
jgi:RNA binding exosome subunit